MGLGSFNGQFVGAVGTPDDDHDVTYHDTAKAIVAFDDVIGIACCDDHAQAACDDVQADSMPWLDGGAHASYEPATEEQVANYGYCMDCGKEVVL